MFRRFNSHVDSCLVCVIRHSFFWWLLSLFFCSSPLQRRHTLHIPRTPIKTTTPLHWLTNFYSAQKSNSRRGTSIKNVRTRRVPTRHTDKWQTELFDHFTSSMFSIFFVFVHRNSHDASHLTNLSYITITTRSKHGITKSIEHPSNSLTTLKSP